jgi:negative regulator of sigma-B (phosphoserine phosphatase)
VETVTAPVVDCGVANFVLPEQEECGDRHLISCHKDGVLIAAIDGIGHGREAANAAKVAISVLKERAGDPITALVERCHQRLRKTRGVVLSLASIHVSDGKMAWLGVGNVQGVLARGDSRQNKAQESLLLRAGVVGSQLPMLLATVLRIAPGDTLYFATDGVRSAFAETLTALENPQKGAERILRQFQSGKDDALVLVARLVAPRP